VELELERPADLVKLAVEHSRHDEHLVADTQLQRPFA
jgi:hypothetical protein